MVYGENSIIVIIIVNIILIAFLLTVLIKNYKNLDKLVRISLSLMLAGGLSNLIDRFFRGYVIDYIDITKIIDYPVFNIADIFVVIGVIITIIYILVSGVKNQENN